MNKGYKIHNQKVLHFLTFAVVDWVDVFTRKRYRDYILDSLKYCQKKKGLILVAYCIMPNHVHLIARASGSPTLSEILRDFKKFTANQIIKSIKKHPESRRGWMLNRFRSHGSMNPKNKYYQFWQQDNHPIELTSHPFIEQKIDYIHQNPVRAGFVYKAEDYPCSSAGWYSYGSGPLKIEVYSRFT